MDVETVVEESKGCSFVRERQSVSKVEDKKGSLMRQTTFLGTASSNLVKSDCSQARELYSMCLPSGM